MKPCRYVVTPNGNRVHLNMWAQMNGVSERTANSRWRLGIRDPMALVSKTRITCTERPNPKLTPEKRAELLELARYSMGMEEQGEMLCDFFPCSRRYAGWLMRELGLA